MQYKYRFIQQILPKSSDNRLIILTGARQTGKTTLVKHRYPQLRYINLDAPENREAVRVVSSFNWGRDIGNAILDEAQKEPELFDKIKYSFDDKQVSFSLLLGSSHILLLKKIRETLAGRVSMYELWPFLMCELSHGGREEKAALPLADRLFTKKNFDDIFGDVPSVILGDVDAAKKEAENYLLRWGGLPSLFPLSAEERWKWLRDYEYTYLERDLSDLARLADLEPFKKFQKLAALRSACLLNYSELSRDASLSADTARRYLEYLKLSYQTIMLQPYYKNITSSVIKTPKIYWVDIGILRQLCGYRGQVESGELYETMVVAELVKWVRTMQREAGLYFYRTRSGLEVDLLIETEEGLIGIEIKSRDKVFSADIRPLKEIAANLSAKWRGGLVIYRGNELKKIAQPDIWAVPSRRLFTA